MPTLQWRWAQVGCINPAEGLMRHSYINTHPLPFSTLVLQLNSLTIILSQFSNFVSNTTHKTFGTMWQRTTKEQWLSSQLLPCIKVTFKRTHPGVQLPLCSVPPLISQHVSFTFNGDDFTWWLRTGRAGQLIWEIPANLIWIIPAKGHASWHPPLAPGDRETNPSSTPLDLSSCRLIRSLSSPTGTTDLL